MSRRWIQLLVIEALALVVLVNVLPAWNKPAASAWAPAVQWRMEETRVAQPSFAPRQAAPRVETRRPDNIPTPPAPSYYAPRFEGAAPLGEAERSAFVRQRLSRTSSDLSAVINKALRNSLPPDWDGESLASNGPGPRYAAESWPRR
jgi:hypothetical protein